MEALRSEMAPQRTALCKEKTMVPLKGEALPKVRNYKVETLVTWKKYGKC